MDRTNVRPTKEQYNMQWKLVAKVSNEIVDTVEAESVKIEQVKEYFRKKKRITRQTLDKLYEVKKYDRD
jgi:hypothetical protein